MHGGLERRRVGGCPAFELEPEQKPCHSVLPFHCRLGPNGTASIRQAARASNRLGAAGESGVAAPVSATEGLERTLPPTPARTRPLRPAAAPALGAADTQLAGLSAANRLKPEWSS
jgi:hypothetical protein